MNGHEAVEMLHEHIYDGWVEGSPALGDDVGPGFVERQRVTVNTTGGQRIKDVGQCHDAGRKWNGLAAQAIGVPGTVPTLVVRAGEGGGPFHSLFDFCARVDKQRVNKRVVEALIKAGAFDALHPDRAAALASVGLAFEWADTQDVNEHQGGLFDFDDSHAASTQEPSLVKVQPWSIKERLTAEKTALGFYLSGHLFEEYAPEVRQFAKKRIADLVDSREPQLLAGIVGDLRVINGQRGRVFIFKLDDGSDALLELTLRDPADPGGTSPLDARRRSGQTRRRKGREVNRIRSILPRLAALVVGVHVGDGHDRHDPARVVGQGDLLALRDGARVTAVMR